MKGSKKGVFSEFLLNPSLGSGSVKGGSFFCDNRGTVGSKHFLIK